MGKSDGANLRRARLFEAFHRQMAVFWVEVPETTTKYKMLWFSVDTHHGQRYFFICGCKRTVKRNGAIAVLRLT